MELAAPSLLPSPWGTGGAETEECGPEPSGALTCAPTLRLQGIARIELLDERVAVFPADDTAGEETSRSQISSMPWAP